MQKFKLILFLLIIVFNFLPSDCYSCDSVLSQCDCKSFSSTSILIKCPKATLNETNQITFRVNSRVLFVKCDLSIEHEDITNYIPDFEGNKTEIAVVSVENCHIPSNYSLQNIVNRFEFDATKIYYASLKTFVFSHHDTNFFEGIDNLQRLALNNYGFANIWNELKNYNEIKNLQLVDVNLTTTEELKFPLCEILSIRDKNLESVHPDTFINLPKLEDLTIGSDKMTTLSEDLFRNSGTIKILMILNHDKKIKTLGKHFLLNLVELHDLTLSVGLQHIDVEFFISNIKLGRLVLANNELTELPKDLFASLVDLHQLDLSNNKLMHLEHGIFAANQGLFIIDLDFNPLSHKTPDLTEPSKNTTQTNE